MLRAEDERAIEDLFERLRRVEQHSGPRDVDAAAFIDRKLTENPAAAYYMAQTIIVQEAALRDQQARLDQLEAELEGVRGGHLREAARRRGPWDRPADGGGFLAGAAQTALGVTGGLLLGSAIAGIFTNNASATESDPAAPEDPGVEEDLGGGDDWGGFDIGGGF